MADPVRLHGLDLLRGIAMLLGVVLHASIAYQAGIRMVSWIDDPASHSYVFDWLYVTINSFRMQLFFALAGFFSCLVIERKGWKFFTRNRLTRIGIPFLLSYALILPLTLAPYLYYQFSIEGREPLMELRHAMIQFFTFRKQWGVMHLWFLYYLMLYYCVAFIWSWARRYIAAGFIDFIGSLRPPLLLAASMLVVAGLGQLYASLVPSIWTGFKPPLNQFAYYGFFFFCGWGLYSYRTVLEYFDKHYRALITAGLLLSIFHAIALNTFFSAGTSFEMRGIFFRSTFAVQTVTLVSGCIGVFNARFATPSAVGKYLSDAAYWVYLIHLPLVLILQLVLLHSSVVPVLRFPLVLLVSVSGALLSYHYLVRNRWIGLLLNGKR